MHCDFVFCKRWVPSLVTYADKVEAPDGPKRFSLHHVLLLTAPRAARVSAFPKSGYRYLGRGSYEIRIFSGGLCHHAPAYSPGNQPAKSARSKAPTRSSNRDGAEREVEGIAAAGDMPCVYQRAVSFPILKLFFSQVGRRENSHYSWLRETSGSLLSQTSVDSPLRSTRPRYPNQAPACWT